MFVAYMYFVNMYVYGYNDWLLYLGCGFLIWFVCDYLAKFGVCRVYG